MTPVVQDRATNTWLDLVLLMFCWSAELNCRKCVGCKRLDCCAEASVLLRLFCGTVLVAASQVGHGSQQSGLPARREASVQVLV